MAIDSLKEMLATMIPDQAEQRIHYEQTASQKEAECWQQLWTIKSQDEWPRLNLMYLPYLKKRKSCIVSNCLLYRLLLCYPYTIPN